MWSRTLLLILEVAGFEPIEPTLSQLVWKWSSQCLGNRSIEWHPNSNSQCCKTAPHTPQSHIPYTPTLLWPQILYTPRPSTPPSPLNLLDTYTPRSPIHLRPLCPQTLHPYIPKIPTLPGTPWITNHLVPPTHLPTSIHPEFFVQFQSLFHGQDHLALSNPIR